MKVEIKKEEGESNTHRYEVPIQIFSDAATPTAPRRRCHPKTNATDISSGGSGGGTFRDGIGF